MRGERGGGEREGGGRERGGERERERGGGRGSMGERGSIFITHSFTHARRHKSTLSPVPSS